MINSVVRIVRMMSAGRRLLHMKMIQIICSTAQALSLVVTILKWCWSICANNITYVGNIWDTNLLRSIDSLSRRSICINLCCYIHVILSTLIWTIRIIWVVWMIRWQNSIMILRTLSEIRIHCTCRIILLIVVVARCICLFSWLRTYSSQSSNSWATLIWVHSIVVMRLIVFIILIVIIIVATYVIVCICVIWGIHIVIICISNRTSALVYVLVWT